MLKKISIGAVVALSIASSVSAEMAYGNPLGVKMTNQAITIFESTMDDERITSKNARTEILCLAQNIYFESRAESMSGKAAVANVTKNRMQDDRWPDTICKVVGEGPVRESWKTKKDKDLADEDRSYYPIKHRCQFSWYCDGVGDVIWANMESTGETIEGNARAWQDSVNVALWTTGYGSIHIEDNTKGAVFYYNHHLVTPSWSKTRTYIGVLGNHTFMK
jgi:spore germination cell wall hydrolase CwlJ-like protein